MNCARCNNNAVEDTTDNVEPICDNCVFMMHCEDDSEIFPDVMDTYDYDEYPDGTILRYTFYDLDEKPFWTKIVDRCLSFLKGRNS